MTPQQCRMARGALDWTVGQLAEKVGVTANTIYAFEDGRNVRPSTEDRILAALTAEGVRFGEANSTVSLERA